MERSRNNKIEKSETESSVSMQGTKLYRQNFEERLQSVVAPALENWGRESKCQRREKSLGLSEGMLRLEISKSRFSEMPFPAFL